MNLQEEIMDDQWNWENPQCVAYLHEITKRFYRNQQYEEAQVLAQGLRRFDALNPEVYLLSGAINQAQGKWDWAIGAYLRVLMLDPMNHAAHFYRAQCYVKKTQWKHALDSVESAILFVDQRDPIWGKYQALKNNIEERLQESVK